MPDDRHVVMVLKDGEPFWKCRTADVTAERIITGEMLQGPRCSPGLAVEVDGADAGTVSRVFRLGASNQYQIDLVPVEVVEPDPEPAPAPDPEPEPETTKKRRGKKK